MQYNLNKILQLQKSHSYKSDFTALDNVNVYILTLEKINANYEELINFNNPKNEYGIYVSEYLKLIKHNSDLLKELAYGFVQIAYELKENNEVDLYARILNSLKQKHEIFTVSKEENELMELKSSIQKLLEHFYACKNELKLQAASKTAENENLHNSLAGGVIT
jgi:hypothetical protein